jgi:hypothetical protein
MSSSNSLTNTILQSSDNSMLELPDIFSTNTSPDVLSSSSETGFFDWMQNMTPMTWLLIILVLAFLGFNIFVYLAKGTDQINTIFSPIINMFSGIFGDTVGEVVDVSAEGAKTVVNTTAGVADAGLSGVQQITPNNANSSVSSVPVTKNQPDVMSNNSLNKALNTSQSSQQINNDYQADEASSSIQSGPPKSGWCYIGEDRGFRTCAEVGPNDKCISGDIFPSQDLCVNPSLRA